MNKLIDQTVIGFGRFLCKKRKKKPYSTIGQILKALTYAYENHNYDFATNGEARVIKVATGFAPKTVIDAGANVGNWSSVAAEYFKNATIHAFEVTPDTFAELNEKCLSHPRIVANQLGLDQQEGQIRINKVRAHHGANSAYPRDLLKSEVEEVAVCDVTTLDQYLSEQGVDQVDFLKIDTEGMDFRVLKGAKEYLSSGSISTIQFEYGMVAVDTGFLLKDFYEMLEGYGYVVGKIYPTYVDFRSYHRSMEDFIGPNFLAVRQELSSQIQAFANA